MTNNYQRAIEAIRQATAPGAAVQLTVSEIRKAAKMSATAFAQFRRGTNGNGIPFKRETLDKNADRIFKAIATAELNRKAAPVAYIAFEHLMNLSEHRVREWIEDHQGAYLCYRFTSTAQKIQVSRLDIFGELGTPKFRQTFAIGNPIFGEPNMRVSEGFAYPIGGCAHMICAGGDEMYHYVISDLKSRSLAHFTGLVCGRSVDRGHLFAARLLAIRFSDEAGAGLPEPGNFPGLNFASDDERRLAFTLDVIEGDRLPLIRRLLSLPCEPGVLRDGLSRSA